MEVERMTVNYFDECGSKTHVTGFGNIQPHGVFVFQETSDLSLMKAETESDSYLECRGGDHTFIPLSNVIDIKVHHKINRAHIHQFFVHKELEMTQKMFPLNCYGKMGVKNG